MKQSSNLLPYSVSLLAAAANSWCCVQSADWSSPARCPDDSDDSADSAALAAAAAAPDSGCWPAVVDDVTDAQDESSDGASQERWVP